jgi:putrescine aminotransferase
MSRLQRCVDQYPQIYEKVTGKGLLIGMHFVSPQIGYQVAAGLFKRGILVAGTLTSAQTIRVEPPLLITFEQLDIFLARLQETLQDVSKTL